MFRVQFVNDILSFSERHERKCCKKRKSEGLQEFKRVKCSGAIEFDR